MAPPSSFLIEKAERTRNKASRVLNIPGLRQNITGFMGEMNKNKTIEELEKLIKQREYSTRRIQELLSSVHATGHIVRKVVKTGANLKDANLEGANLERAILRRADLRRS